MSKSWSSEAPNLAARSAECNLILRELLETPDVLAKREELRQEFHEEHLWIPVQDIVKKGKALDNLTLHALGITEDMFKYYDRQTGKFNYVPTKPISLALENGDSRLHSIRLNFSNDKAFEHLLRDYQMVLQKIPDMELWITHMTKDSSKLDHLLESFPIELRSRLKLLPTPHNLAENLLMWSQDSSKPTSDGEIAISKRLPRQLLLPHELNRNMNHSNSLKATLLSGFTRPISSSFLFDGGNVIVGAKNIFIGSEALFLNSIFLHITEKEVIKALSAEFGKKVVVIPQIDFHIDLTMAVVRDHFTGKEAVLLSSPRVALEAVLGYPMPMDNISVEEMGRFFKTVAGSHPELQKQLKFNQNRLSRDYYIRNAIWSEMTKQEEELAKTRKKLEASGYKVIMVPGLNAAIIDHYTGESDFSRFFNYTNMIVSGQTALVSKMKVQKMDDYFYYQMKSLGYDLIEMPSSKLLFRFNGGIRCAAETHRLPKSVKDVP